MKLIVCFVLLYIYITLYVMMLNKKGKLLYVKKKEIKNRTVYIFV